MIIAPALVTLLKAVCDNYHVLNTCIETISLRNNFVAHKERAQP